MIDNKNRPDASGPTPLYAWYVLSVLIVAYTVSFIDRQILTLMVGPIRETLHITDSQFSLLHGLAFALFYTVLGIPIGRLVDRRRRTTIIAVGVVVWSGMTALCGFAQNFVQLFMARIGVGVGEAALSPGAYSMLSDSFPPKKLPQALSMYTGAAHVGAGIATMAGGALIAHIPAMDLPFGHLEPWQAVFVVIGLPGILVALVVATLREPKRTGVKAGIPLSLRAVFDYMAARRKAFGLLIMGYALSSLMWNGTVAWLPTFFIRKFGWTTDMIGFRYGLVIILGGTCGVLLGGFIASRLRQRGLLDANVRVGIIALAIALPFGVAGALAPSASLALALFAPFLFGCAMPYGAAAAAIQEITPNQMRGQISAIYLFCLNLFGIGLGPTVVALYTDHVFGNDAAISYSLALNIAIAAPLAALLLWLACKPYREEMVANAAT